MRDVTRLSIPLLLITCLAACNSTEQGDAAEASAVDANAVDTSVAQSHLSNDAASSQAAVVASQTTDKLQKVGIQDEAGFGRPLVAATVQIPADWQTRGGVSWDRRSQCVANHLRLNWLAGAPNNSQAFEIMPGYNWQVQGTEIQMNPCPPLAIRNPQGFLQMIAQRYSNVRVLNYRERPDLAPPAQSANGANVQVAAGELLIAYNRGSEQVSELLTAVLTASEMQGNVVIGVPAVYAYRTVGQQPDPRVSDRFINSMQVDSQWMANVQQASQALIERIAQQQRNEIATWHAGRMAEINARGAADRSRIWAQSNREVSQIYANTWSNSQATDDRIHRRTLEGIGEYTTYADPAGGGVVRESTQYDRVIRTEGGGYISTNDPYLKPAGSEELERIP